ncbi:MAG: tetratricopeptide repeat protein [Coriobacteriia bacterium]|nr:tetratricopeptide repeat protein [Coriobacteriia bacterium]
MSDTSRSSSDPGRRSDRLLLGAVIVAAVLAAALGYYTWSLLPKDSDTPATAFARDLARADAVVDAAPEALMPRLRLADVYFKYRDYDTAIDVLEDARSIEATAGMRAYLEVGLARVYEAKGDDPSAKDHYERALEHEQSFDANYALGRMARDEGRLGDAMRHWERALELNRSAATLRIELAKAYADSGRKGSALEQLRTAREYLPDEPEIERLLRDLE